MKARHDSGIVSLDSSSTAGRPSGSPGVAHGAKSSKGIGRRDTSFLPSRSNVAKTRTSGVALLEIPENYYDDLAARVDLPADRLKVLKANNILYDKDEHGEYLQLYTKSFKDSFFLEIVERRGYKGFGAINAPIRLNAQSRTARGAADSAI